MDAGLYLPPFKSVNIYFMKEVMAMKKKAIKSKDVQHIYAPQYETLTCAKIYEFVQHNAEARAYFPVDKDVPALPRQVSDSFQAPDRLLAVLTLSLLLQWILNVCNTVIGSAFTDWIKSCVSARNDSMAEKRDMNVAIDPEILAVIRASNAVSTQKGSSAALLKIGAKRRRTRAEIDEHRAREADMRAHQQSQEERIAELERQVNSSKQKLQAAH